MSLGERIALRAPQRRRPHWRPCRAGSGESATATGARTGRHRQDRGAGRHRWCSDHPPWPRSGSPRSGIAPAPGGQHHRAAPAPGRRLRGYPRARHARRRRHAGATRWNGTCRHAAAAGRRRCRDLRPHGTPALAQRGTGGCCRRARRPGRFRAATGCWRYRSRGDPGTRHPGRRPALPRPAPGAATLPTGPPPAACASTGCGR